MTERPVGLAAGGLTARPLRQESLDRAQGATDFAGLFGALSMFLIASATALGTLGVVLLSYRRLFTAAHQFRHHLLAERTGKS